MGEYAARSPAGNTYRMTSRAEHVRLLSQGYTDVTSEQQQPAPEPRRWPAPKPTTTPTDTSDDGDDEEAPDGAQD